jgi:hypothetical protein
VTLSRDRLIWGWVRLLLGMAQIILATMALMTLLTLGLAPLTWASSTGPLPQRLLVATTLCEPQHYMDNTTIIFHRCRHSGHGLTGIQCHGRHPCIWMPYSIMITRMVYFTLFPKTIPQSP